MTQKFLKQMSGQQVSHARTSLWQEWGRGLGFGGANLDSFMSLCASFEDGAQEPLSSKTCTGFSLATEDETSQSYSRRWTNSGMVSRGVCLTARTLESPSNVDVSTLLPCIEDGEIPEKYFLSPNAATGILRRVDQMGRNLPPSFRQSLEMLAKAPRKEHRTLHIRGVCEAHRHRLVAKLCLVSGRPRAALYAYRSGKSTGFPGQLDAAFGDQQGASQAYRQSTLSRCRECGNSARSRVGRNPIGNGLSRPRARLPPERNYAGRASPHGVIMRRREERPVLQADQAR